MRNFMIFIALLIMSFTINAQDLDTKTEVVKIGLVIDNNEFSNSLQTRCFEIYKYQNQMYLQEMAVNNNLDIPKPDCDFGTIICNYFISQSFNSKINDEILLSKEQSDIIRSLLRLSQINIEPSWITSNAPDYVFILDDRNNPVVMRDICDTELLYKSLTTNNRRHVKRILRDLTNDI